MRYISPVKINEFGVQTSSPTNSTNSFIEHYNAGASAVDLSNWTLTQRPYRHAIFSTIKVPAGTTLAAGGFYLLGLSNSGLAIPASAGDSAIYVRSVTGLAAGHTIDADGETRTIVSVGTAATGNTTLWQPLPDGPVITIPAGATRVPVANGTCVTFTPALTQAYLAGQSVVHHGTGLDLAAPLQFEHASNLPFTDCGTGISFTPATAFPHSSNEPVQALGTGRYHSQPSA